MQFGSPIYVTGLGIILAILLGKAMANALQSIYGPSLLHQAQASGKYDSRHYPSGPLVAAWVTPGRLAG